VRIWITGGAGYVGSAVARACQDRGYRPVVIDDLSTGSREAIADLPFYKCDVADRFALREIASRERRPDVVIHAAGLLSANDSVSAPLAYYRDNVAKTLTLCEFLIEARCPHLVVESSAAVYGNTTAQSVDELSPVMPVSPYAYSKAALERMLHDVAAAHPLRITCLRLFNVVGAARDQVPSLTSSGVLAAVLAAANGANEFAVYGDDWETVDGTPVRDFVHVRDVARAHLAVIEEASSYRMHQTFDVLNISTGVGTTIKQLLRLCASLGMAPTRAMTHARRPGDVAGFVGTSLRAREVLEWQPSFSLADAILSEQFATSRVAACSD
jgi:UDP-glucose 4-epimerase